MEEPKRLRGQRGPNRVKRERMRVVGIRLPKEVVDYFDGSTTAMRAVLVTHVQGSGLI